MKFPRNARVFRGQLDAAPFASVLFLLVLFLLVQSSLVFVPGVRLIPLGGASPRFAVAGEMARLSAARRILFASRRFSEEEFVVHLRGLASSNQLPAQLTLLAEPGAHRRIRDAVPEGSRGRALVAVGPEGGWSDGEIELLERHGFVRIGLNTGMLRVDTACVALLAVVGEMLS